MTYREFVIIFASFLLFLGQCGYSNGQSCQDTACENSGVGTNTSFLIRMPEPTGQEGCYIDGITVKLTCKYGNFAEGSSQTDTCSNGAWNNTEAACTGYCTFNSDDDNLVWLPNQRGYNVTETLAFSCKKGSKLKSDSPTSFLCVDGGTWDQDSMQPGCIAFSCSNPNITEGNITWTPKADETTYDGHQTIKYSCPDGVTLDGKDTNTCVDQDEWESAHPTCMSSGNVIQAFWYLLTVTTSYTLLSFYM